MTPPRRHAALPAFQSFRVRLPVLISALIVIVLAAFLWAAYREVKGTLLQAGGARAQGAADQLANLLQPSAQRLNELRRIAASDPVRRCVERSTDEACGAARATLAALTGNMPQMIELWNRAGQRVLVSATPKAEGRLPAGSAPSAVGVGPLHAYGDVVYSENVVEIHEPSAGESAAPTAARLGFLVVRRPLQAASTADVLNRLVGSGASVKIGNRTDEVWTDLSKRVPPPAVDLRRPGVSEYRGADGKDRVGALADIRGTPWALWVEFPKAFVLAPADAFLGRLTLVGFVIVGVAAILVSILSARITTPLHDLTNASEAIASGDYARRVATDRRDEMGRLGAAFNTMADQVDQMHQDLETRVQQRTCELEQNAEALKLARVEAERANLAKSEFLSRMSHELRTPLNAILGFAQVLEMEGVRAEQADNVRQILRGGQHLLELINEVLDISRIETGRLSLSPEPVAPHDVVDRAVALVQPLAAEREITVTVQPIPDRSPALLADRHRLNQILLNLLSNAVKYNRRSGTVTVAFERGSANRSRIAVTDTGAGIPAAKLRLLFQPFERLEAAETSVEGTGLGLALSRALAHAMGGTIGVDSVVDRGSTFWVELPEADHQTDARPVPVAGPALPGNHGRGGVILYIEDNLSNARLMERVLRQRPRIELVHASHGEAGVAMVRERRPDIILLDMHLPDMSGEDVVRRLWEDPVSRRVPIVVVTADVTPGLIRRVQGLGVTATLTKPLDLGRVLELVDGLMDVGHEDPVDG
jgi:signal transduction histidine kinase/CheY-like chemotaxis protein